ncbi:MAG: hypothetical protein Q4G58_13405 [bacterium]|nr:hypothetical protein [bacterium]
MKFVKSILGMLAVMTLCITMSGTCKAEGRSTDTNTITITGVKDKNYYNKAKTLKFSGQGLSKVVVNGKTNAAALKKKQVKLEKKGKNVVTVFDSKGNQRTVTFYIDKSSPTITGVSNNKTYVKQKTLKFDDNYRLKKITVNGKTDADALKNKKVTFKKQGTYTVKAFDQAGNTKTIKFKIKFDSVHKLKAAKKYSQLVVISVKNKKTTVTMHVKDKNGYWSEILYTSGDIGKYGLGKGKEGDAKTPVGIFNLNYAFGIKKNPGAKVSYKKVNKYDYWNGDYNSKYFNTLCDSRKVKFDLSNSEHIIDYGKVYNYCVFFDYNKEGKKNRGSCFYLHCKGKYGYTLGCVGVSEQSMIKILKNLNDNCAIIIDYDKNISKY